MSHSRVSASPARSSDGRLPTLHPSTCGPDVSPGTHAAAGSDVEAERPELLPAVLGYLVRPPRRKPDPVDAELGDHAVERLRGLILDHIGERTGGAGERHVNSRRPVVA